jgi:hypothetical protein
VNLTPAAQYLRYSNYRGPPSPHSEIVCDNAAESPVFLIVKSFGSSFRFQLTVADFGFPTAGADASTCACESGSLTCMEAQPCACSGRSLQGHDRAGESLSQTITYVPSFQFPRGHLHGSAKKYFVK